MEETIDYRFGPVLTPEPEPELAATEVAVDDTPVQADIAATTEPDSVKPQIRAEIRA